MWLEGRLTFSIEVQRLSKLSGKFIRSQQMYSICPSPMIQEETHNMCVRNVTIPVLIIYIFPMWLEGRLSCSIEVQLVTKLSGKFIRSQQIFCICPSPMIQEETYNMCVRNVTIPVLIQHFSNVTRKYVDLLNRSATCKQIIWKVHKKSTDLFKIIWHPWFKRRHIICVLGLLLSQCWYNIFFQCDWKVGYPAQ
jgi:hypothetical protein